MHVSRSVPVKVVKVVKVSLLVGGADQKGVRLCTYDSDTARALRL